MKIRTMTALVSVVSVLIIGTNCNASYTITETVSPTSIHVLPGDSGQIDFQFQFANTGAPVQADWVSAEIGTGTSAQLVTPSFVNWSIDPASTIGLGYQKRYHNDSTLNFIVDWTVLSGTPIGDSGIISFGLGVKDPDGNYMDPSQSVPIIVSTSAAPEPGQMVASLMIFCLGGSYVGWNFFRRNKNAS